MASRDLGELGGNTRFEHNFLHIDGKFSRLRFDHVQTLSRSRYLDGLQRGTIYRYSEEGGGEKHFIAKTIIGSLYQQEQRLRSHLPWLCQMWIDPGLPQSILATTQ